MIDPPSKPDPLSEVIALLRPRSVAQRLITLHDPAAIRFPSVPFVVFGQLVEGGGEVTLDGATPLALRAGDFLLLSAPGAWRFATRPDARTVDALEIFANPAFVVGNHPDPAVTRLIAGGFTFAADHSGLIDTLVPPIVHISGAEVAAERLGALLRLLTDEALAERPGRTLALERLLELLLLEALRHTRNGPAPTRGLLAGLADPRIGAALRTMHADAGRRWTVAALARQAGMSRSAFAERFAETVGTPPIDYLAAWRMSLAKDALRVGRRPVAEAAELAGYGSVSAFSTAFTRAVGCAPSAFAKAPAA